MQGDGKMNHHNRTLAIAHESAIQDGQGPAFIAAMRKYLEHHDKLERAKQ